MPTRASPEVRETRKQALAPLFNYMTARGTHRSWLARQLDISVARVWNYEHGYNTPPDWFVARACKALGVTPKKLGLASLSEGPQRPKRATRATSRGSTYHGNSANLDDTHPQSLARSAAGPL